MLKKMFYFGRHLCSCRDRETTHLERKGLGSIENRVPHACELPQLQSESLWFFCNKILPFSHLPATWSFSCLRGEMEDAKMFPGPLSCLHTYIIP